MRPPWAALFRGFLEAASSGRPEFAQKIEELPALGRSQAFAHARIRFAEGLHHFLDALFRSREQVKCIGAQVTAGPALHQTALDQEID